MPRGAERGDVVGVLLGGEDRVARLAEQQRRAHALDRRATRATSPAVTDTTTSTMRSSGPGTISARSSRSTGSPAFQPASDVLVGLVEHDVHEAGGVGQLRLGRGRARPPG